MSSKSRSARWLSVGSLLGLVPAGLFCAHEYTHLRRVASQQAKLIDDRSRIQKEIAALDARLCSPNAFPEDTSPSLEVLPASVGASADSNPSASSPKAVAALRTEARKADARATFGPFFHTLGLSPEKTAAIIERFALYLSNRDKLFTEIPAGPQIDANDPMALSVKTRLAEEDAHYNAAIESILGPDDFHRFEQFQREARFWSQASNLATQLYATETPLTPPQARQLVAVLVAGATNAHNEIVQTVPNWEAVFNQAAGFLSPPQLEVLKAIHENDDLWRQLNRMSGKARSKL